MSTPMVKTYFSYHELISDFARLSGRIDFNKTLIQAPPMSFYTTDGRVVLGGNFIHFLKRVREELGIKVNAFSSEEQRGFYVVSYEDYSVVEEEELPSIEIKAVDTPAKKRSQRTTAK